MKKIIFISFALAIASANVNAQGKKTSCLSPEQLAEEITTKLNEDLVLSDVQKVKVKEVILKREQQREITIKQMERSREVFKEANKLSMKIAEDSLKTILTPEQMNKMKHHKKQMKKNARKKAVPNESAPAGK